MSKRGMNEAIAEASASGMKVPIVHERAPGSQNVIISILSELIGLAGEILDETYGKTHPISFCYRELENHLIQRKVVSDFSERRFLEYFTAARLRKREPIVAI